jgi:hypothetical protein
MMGTEKRRMRRRPMRSMEWKATRVKMKFVRAMEREVRVGEWKPTRRKMVAEKYMREFWGRISKRSCKEGDAGTTYEATELLEALEHACDNQRSSVSADVDELCETIVDAAEFGAPGALCSLGYVPVSGCFFLF